MNVRRGRYRVSGKQVIRICNPNNTLQVPRTAFESRSHPSDESEPPAPTTIGSESERRRLFSGGGNRPRPRASRPSRSSSTARRRSRSSSALRARRRTAARSSRCFPETFVPVYPSNRWARELAPARTARSCWRASRSSRSRFPAPTPTRLGAAARERGHLARGRRQRARARHDLQLAAHLRARRHARAAAPQARADEPRAPGLGAG